MFIGIHTKFHIPTSNVSLVIAIRPESTYRLYASAMVMFYTLRKIIIIKVAIF
jgi:hypothetical protein